MWEGGKPCGLGREVELEGREVVVVVAEVGKAVLELVCFQWKTKQGVGGG